MDYGNLFARAWKITWNNKILWLFGLFAGVGGGSFNFNSRGSGNITGPNQPIPPQIRALIERYGQSEMIGIAITIACLILLIALAFIVLSIIARGGLIVGVQQADTNGTVTFSEAWAGGLRNFWRLLGLGLLQALPIIVFALLGVVFAIITGGMGAVCLLPLVCVLVILLIPYSLVFWLASFNLALDGAGIVDSVRRGWALLKANVAPVLIVGIILGIGGLVIGVVTLIPLFVIAAPVLFTFISNPDHPNIPVLIGAGVAFLCLLPVLWAVGAVLNTYIYSTWVLLYRQIAGPAATPAAPTPDLPYQPA